MEEEQGVKNTDSRLKVAACRSLKDIFDFQHFHLDVSSPMLNLLPHPRACMYGFIIEDLKVKVVDPRELGRTLSTEHNISAFQAQ